MAIDIMVDLETGDIMPTSTILTIGAQGFDPFSTKFTDVTYYERITLESQESRTINNDTLKWWSQQSPEAQEEAFGADNRISLEEGLKKLQPLLRNADRVWANGTTFDITILENAFREHGYALPWQYWQVMDTRTIYKITPGLGKLGNGHNALGDCVNQINHLQKAIKDS